MNIGSYPVLTLHISRVTANKLKDSVPSLVDKAFIGVTGNVDNILITHEQMKGHHHNNRAKGWALRANLMNSIEWSISVGHAHDDESSPF